MIGKYRVGFGWRVFPLVACVGLLAGALAGSNKYAFAVGESGCGTKVDCNTYANKVCNACGTGFATCGYRTIATGYGFEIASSPANKYSGVMGSEFCFTYIGCKTSTTQCPTNPTKLTCVSNNIPFDVQGREEGVFSPTPCDD